LNILHESVVVVLCFGGANAGSSTAQWVAEDGSLTETDATFDDVTLTPKTVGAMTSYSRRTLLNASPSIEQIVRNDLAATIASAIDYQAMVGDGQNNTPLGIVGQTGVGNASLATPTWAQVLAVIATVGTANALLDGLGWAIHPLAIAQLRAKSKRRRRVR
jgi:HK97 family phage major capsid protein